MNRKRTYSLLILVLVILVYWVGPKPEAPTYSKNFPKISLPLKALEDSITTAEITNEAIKINNEARIIWANDSLHEKTPWAIVYLHGFTASQMEGYPVHKDVAAKNGMNLYLARLSDHGLDSNDALVKLTPDRLWETAKLALAIGHKLGDKVILMSTSTGGTLAIKLAQVYPDKVDALINFSPNIRINNVLAPILNNPWGLSILKLVAGNYIDNSASSDSLISQYWTVKYRAEALPQLEELVETTMVPNTFKHVKCPSLTIAYFKDKEHQDPTVKVSAQRWMHELLGTPPSKKKYIELSTVGVHPLASNLRSKDIPAVELATNTFINEIIY